MTSTDPPRPRRRRRPRALHLSLGAVVLIVLAVAASVAFFLSAAGLPFVIARVVAQTGGRLSVEGASGSLASTMHFARLEWHGPETTVTAHEVVVEWRALALFSRRLAIRGLGAREIAIAVKPSAGATAPPASLALPLAVTMDHVAVSELDWQAGPRTGKITGLEFGYEGDALVHRIRGLRFVHEAGALSGDAALQATAPFALEGGVAIVGDGPLAGAKLGTTLSGTLPEITVDATGTMRAAALTAHIDVTPFAGNAFRAAAITLDNVDLAAFHAALPRTRLKLDLDARPREGGAAGTFRAVNGQAGSIDEERLPVAAAAGRYDFATTVLALSDLDVTLAGGAHASGDGRVDLAAADAASRWRLAVHDLDLARLHRSLVTTRLTGSFSADVEGSRQTFAGDLSQQGLAVAFAATYAERRLDVARFRAQAGGGTLEGSGRIGLDAPRAFEVALRAQRFDPARFAALPSGALVGSLKATGTLLPEWRTSADIAVAPGSRLAGIAIAGTARGTATRRSLQQAAIDITAGGAHLALAGNAGSPGDRLTVALDAPRLTDLAPLLPATFPRPLAGRLHANGTLAVEPGGIGGDLDLDGSGLAVGTRFAAERLSLQASLAPGGAAPAATPLDARRIALSSTASKLIVAETALTTARVELRGTLANHTASLAAQGSALDATAQLAGGFIGVTAASPADALRWSGRVMALQNRGEVPLQLAAPAILEASPRHARLADARIAVADGHADIGELQWNDGRVTTRGAFERVPLASLATVAGRPLPFASTLTLAGDWSITALPRLSGSFTMRREAGDIFGAQTDATGIANLGLGVDALELDGTLRDDALAARLVFRSARGGRAEGTLSLGAVTGAPSGRIARNAPLALKLDAELASLAPLQPWLGTAAVVNGNAKIALGARGTLDAPEFSGTIAGDALRIDAAQYGINLRDGRVRAHLADGGIVVDELSLVGGDGRFTASGTIGARAGAAGTRIAWQAENFRVTNRPDLRLVVAGEGTLAVVQRRLALAGTVRVVEGKIEYEPAPSGQLGPDVVVVGRTTRAENKDSIAQLPLTLDVDVDLGRRLTFDGSGLDTSLEGHVRVTTAVDGHLLGRGTITAANGTYFAFGQKLTIDRGRLIFDGPLDNPALDVVALRKNLAVEAGVEVSGTVKVPRVRITSNPPVPENEALAWLVTGEGLSGSSRSDYAALAAASAALLSRGGKPITTQFAQSIGLDDISVRSGGIGTSGTTGAAGQVVVFGKRITDRLTLGYEQGLSIAANALRLEYALTNTLTLRAEAGMVSGVGVYYRRAFD